MLVCLRLVTKPPPCWRLPRLRRRSETFRECLVRICSRVLFQKSKQIRMFNLFIMLFNFCILDPNAEVIALSPKTLLATNRFVCEICNKGFQRDQNLQLHRRGHNLPWKLRQRTTKEVRKRVYVCPEPSCVHHNPARALGDLTGIKKHFCRKHGEKKWKCERCSKKYAVQSDWKAHMKTCGTREYKCDCGTLFSRQAHSSSISILPRVLVSRENAFFFLTKKTCLYLWQEG